MSETGSGNPIARALVMAALIDGVCVVVGLVLFLMTDNILWLIAGFVLGAVFSLPQVLKIFRGPRA
ncbi:MAG: hypothetical protein AAGI14_04210 [Pseudomonadota bacterium]